MMRREILVEGKGPNVVTPIDVGGIEESSAMEGKSGGEEGKWPF